MKCVNVLTGEAVQADFATAYIRPLKDESERPSPASIVEQAYVPPQAQIQDMMDAGVRLAAYRKARFDTVELQIAENGDVPLDVTREPGADLVDVQRAAEDLEARLGAEASKAEIAARAKAKADAEAADAARIEARARAILAEQAAIKEGVK